ncbi:LysM peptidoglycan-binding domain-containing protein [Vibrio vulnificus]|nr:LysM peptidoglycan-binding domain-containing protein [Vibrio vulnificus]
MAVVIGGAGLGNYDVLGQAGIKLSSTNGLNINASTGNLVIRGNDHSLVSRGLDLSLARTYNSQGTKNDFDGDNWRFSFEKNIRAIGTNLQLTTGDGHAALFKLQKDGSYFSSAGTGAHDTIRKVGSNWVYTEGSTGISETYRASDGRLLSTEDKHGNKITYRYNGNQLAAISGASGEELRFVYNTKGQLTRLDSFTNVGGKLTHTHSAIHYAYDAKGRLAQVKVDLTPADKSIADGKVFTTTYTYQDANSHLLKSIQKSDGNRIDLAYQTVDGKVRLSRIDDNGIVTELNYQSKRANGHQLQVTDNNGEVWYYKHDDKGRLVSTLSPTVDYKNNVAGLPRGDGQQQGLTTYQYDDQDNLIIVRDSTGKEIQNKYDANGNLTEVLRNGVVQLRHDYSGKFLVASHSFNNGQKEASAFYVYENGKVRFEISAKGTVTEHNYNGFGERTSMRQYAGANYTANTAPSLSAMVIWTGKQNKQQSELTEYTYQRGELYTQTTYNRLDDNGRGDTISDLEIISWGYDYRSGSIPARGVYIDGKHAGGGARGVTITVVDANNKLVSAKSFDTNGDLSASAQLTTHLKTLKATTKGLKVIVTTSDEWVNRLGPDAKVALAAMGITNKTLDNAEIRSAFMAVVEAKDGNWVTTHEDYRPRFPASILNHKISNAEHVRTTYDAFGNLISTQTLTGNIKIGQVDVKSTTTQVYDGLNRVTSTTDGAGNTTKTQYLDASRQVLVTTENGVTTRRTFSERGELISETVSATGEISRERTYIYNASDQLVATEHANGSLTTQFYDDTGLLWISVSASGQVTEYQRDSEGRVIREIQYESALSTQNWILRGQLTVSGNDVLGLIDAGAQHRVIRTEFDALGRVHRVIDGEQQVTEYVYDNLDRQVKVRHYKEGFGQSARELNSKYDKASKLTEQVDADGFIKRFFYDNAGNLVETKLFKQNMLLAERNPSQEHDRTQTFYDSRGRQQYVLDEQGYLTETRYLDGGREKVTYRYSNTVASRDGGVDSILRQAGTAKQLSRERYDAAGRLASSTDMNGIEIVYHYDSITGQLRQQVTAANTNDSRSVYFDYNKFGELTGRVAVGGKQDWKAVNVSNLVDQRGTRSIYNVMGWKISDHHPATGRTEYQYDNAGRLIKATDALGNTRSTRYTAFGQVKQSLAGGVVKAEYGYDRAGRVNREVDGESAVTTYIYNNQGQVQYQVRQHVSDAYQAFQSASGHLISRQVTQYHYDARGNVIERQTAQDYRSGTRISGGDTLTDVRGSSLRYQAQWTRKYDHQGRVVSEVDGAGREKVIDYLHGGRIKTVKLSGALQERIELDALGRTLSIANGVGATTRYEYDDTRNTVTVVSPGGIRTVTEKNAHGETVSITDGLGNRRLFHYNHNGQVVRTEFRAANSSTSEVLSSKEYDANTGLLRFETNAEGTRTEIRYNAIGKQWKVIRDANGEKLQTEYGYDSQGQRIWEDTEGQRTYVRYDNNGQKVRVEQGGIATTYQYDANGNVIRKVEGVVSGANVVREERVTEYNYDTNANLLAKRIKSGSDWTGTGSSHITRYSYDGAGNVIEKASGVGGVTRYVYDNLGRVKYEVNALRYVTEFQYDDASRLTKTVRYNTAVANQAQWTESTVKGAIRISSADRTTELKYDKEGRIEHEIDGKGYATGYTYDANGQVIRTTAYGKKVSESGWNSVSAEKRISESIYDAKGRLQYTINSQGLVSEYNYDNEDRITHTIKYGVNLTLASRSSSALTAFKAKLANEKAAGNTRTEQVVYDALGRKRFMLDADGYLIEHQYNKKSQLEVKKEFIDSNAVLNALKDSRKTQSSKTEYQLFVGFTSTLSRYVNSSGSTISSNKAILTQLNMDRESAKNALAKAQSELNKANTIVSNHNVSNLSADYEAKKAEIEKDYREKNATYEYMLQNKYVYINEEQGSKGKYTEAQVQEAKTQRNNALVALNEFKATLAKPVSQILDDAKWILQKNYEEKHAEYTHRLNNKYVYVSEEQGYKGLYTQSHINEAAAARSAALKLQQDFEREFAHSNSSVYQAHKSVSAWKVAQAQYDGYREKIFDLVKAFQNRTSEAVGQFHTNEEGVVSAAYSPSQIASYQKTSAQAARAFQNFNMIGAALEDIHLAQEQVAQSQMRVNDISARIASLDQEIESFNKTSHDTNYAYDAHGRLEMETSATVDYASILGTSTSLTEHSEGLKTIYTYDSLGNVVSKSTASGTNMVNTQRFEFNVMGSQTKAIGLAGSSVIYNDQNLATVNINAEGGRRDRVYDQVGRLRFEIDEEGYVTEHKYNGFGEKTKQVRYSNPYSATRPHGNEVSLDTMQSFINRGGESRTIEWKYDKTGRVTDTDHYDGSNSKAESKTARKSYSVEYNAFGEKTKTTLSYADENKNTEYVTGRRFYNNEGQLIYSMDARGYVTKYLYNGFGEVFEQTQYVKSLSENSSNSVWNSWTLSDVTSWIEKNNTGEDRKTSFTYDKRGNTLTTTRHDVRFHEYGNNYSMVEKKQAIHTTTYHDYAGRLFMTVEEAGAINVATHSTAANRTLYAYDALGRLTSSWGKEREYLLSGLAIDKSSFTSPSRIKSHQRTEFFYDAQGNQICVETEGRRTFQYFNSLGKQFGRRDGEGHYTSIDTDAMNRVTKETQSIAVSDGELNYSHSTVKSFDYDKTGRQIETKTASSSGFITEKVIYNAFGEVQSKRHIASGINAEQESYQYDALGRVKSATRKGVISTYEYNWLDKVTLEKTDGSRSVHRDYDEMGNIKSEHSQSANGKESITTQDHDRFGNVTKRTINNVEYLFTYNCNNQVSRQTIKNIETVRASGTVGDQSVDTEMFYNQQGNRLAVQDANQNLQRTIYDLAGNKLADINGLGKETVYINNAHGELVGRVNGQGIGEVFTYNKNGLLLSRSKLDLDANYLKVYTKYAYDQAGRRSSEEWLGATGYTQWTKYDQAGRVLETKGSGQHRKYTYDSFGNKQSEAWLENGKQKAIKSATFDIYGRRATETWLDGTVVSYVYNARGELTRKHGGGVDISYLYFDNGLLEKQSQNGKSESYEYDVNGNQTKRTLIEGKEHFVTDTTWDDLGRLKTIASQATLGFGKSLENSKVTYFYDAVGNRRKVTTRLGSDAEETRWYHYDAENRLKFSYEGAKYNRYESSLDGNGGARIINYNASGQKENETTWRSVTRDGKKAVIKEKSYFSYDSAGHLNGILSEEYKNGTAYETRKLGQLNSRSGHALGQFDATTSYQYSNGVIRDNSSTNTRTITEFGYQEGRLLSQTVSENSRKKYDITFAYHYSGQLSAQITSLLTQNWLDTTRHFYAQKDSFRKEKTVASRVQRGYKDGVTNYIYNPAGHLTQIDSTKSESARKVLSDFNGQIALQLAGGKLSAELAVGGNPVAQLSETKLNADLLSDSAATTGAQPGAYTVQQNDNLQRIAQIVYGDSRYWYLIADANGISPNDQLTAGKSLVIPNQHTQTYNGAESFKPYNESEVLGNVNPDPIAPPPPKKSCNPVVMIVMAVVAVVVTVYTAGAASAAMASMMGATGTGVAGAATIGAAGMGVLGGAAVGTSAAAGLAAAAIGGAVGSAASQLVGMAMGVVDEFSWDQVALGGLAAGATAGMGAAFSSGGVFGAVDDAANLGLRQAGNSMVNSAVNYTTNYLGNKALGNDVSFSWTNLAASAAGSVVSLGASGFTSKLDIVGDALSGFAGAATSSVLRGESFRDNAGQMMADAFGNALANVARREITQPLATKYQPISDDELEVLRSGLPDNTRQLDGEEGSLLLANVNAKEDDPLSWLEGEQVLLDAGGPSFSEQIDSALSTMAPYVRAKDALAEYFEWGEGSFEESANKAVEQLLQDKYLEIGYDICLPGGAEPDVNLSAYEYDNRISDIRYVRRDKPDLIFSEGYASYNIRSHNGVFGIENLRSEFSGPALSLPNTTQNSIGFGVDLVGEAVVENVQRWQQQKVEITGQVQRYSTTVRYGDGATDFSFGKCISYDIDVNPVGPVLKQQSVQQIIKYGKMSIGLPSPMSIPIR